MIPEPGPHNREPTSPELVLVSSPEVARRAREELPLPAAPPRLVQAPARTQPAVPRVRRPRRRLRVALAVIVLGALGGEIWYVTAERDDTEPAKVSALSPPRTVPPPASLSPSPTDTQPAPTRSQTTRAPAPPPVVTPVRKPKPAKPRTPATTKPKPKAPARFVPARTWAWAASPGARSYVFRLALNGRTVLRARTKQPRFVLPGSFRFRAGSYRWTVRRIPASQGGRPLYSSFFVISPAVAAAANR
jgi:hypothetical protein